mmetsp:Transcript_44487/g.87921  ORF Transcript_44487/g.87921 Transcript_44487/m.87921 type:complete len:82 (-) Transcript_44487:788-1033(-)
MTMLGSKVQKVSSSFPHHQSVCPLLEQFSDHWHVPGSSSFQERCSIPCIAHLKRLSKGIAPRLPELKSTVNLLCHQQPNDP